MIRYGQLKKSCALAELTGIILGDGSLERSPRTERIRIVAHSADTKYIEHIVGLFGKIFHREPTLMHRKSCKAVDVSLYQCELSDRLQLPAGNKIRNNVGIPNWIKRKRCYVVACLKGLFETDGCFQEDSNNYAQYIEFKNFCPRLIKDVHELLVKLGYHPQLSKRYVRVARRQEVYRFKEEIDFRNH